jgi:hypothetical protein
MATTQSEDPNERVDHPRHYNAHQSGIETIELIEHLPYNLGAAIKYIWRCGLKSSETPLRDLSSAKWYTKREISREEIFELGKVGLKTEVVWRSLARKVIASEPECTLAYYLDALLCGRGHEMTQVLDEAIDELLDADTSAS